MKSIFFSFILLLGGLGTFGQDTLSREDFPKKGDMFPVSYVNLDQSTIPWALFYTGISNFNFDISNLSTEAKGFDEMKDPDDVDGGDQVPNAAYAFEYDYGNGFFSNNGDSINMEGLSPNLDFQIPLTFAFDSVVNFITAPLTYGQKMVDSTTSKLEIPFLLTVNAKMTSKYEVNGFGTLKLPGDTTFEVLRLRRVLTFYAIANQMLTQQIDTVFDSLVTWEFYSKGYNSTVLRAEVNLVENDSTIDTLALFTFFDKKPVGITKSISQQLKTKVTLRANSIIAESNIPASIWVYNTAGLLVASNPNKQFLQTISLQSFPTGTYIVVLNNEQGVSSELIIKP